MITVARQLRKLRDEIICGNKETKHLKYIADKIQNILGILWTTRLNIDPIDRSSQRKTFGGTID